MKRKLNKDDKGYTQQTVFAVVGILVVVMIAGAFIYVNEQPETSSISQVTFVIEAENGTFEGSGDQYELTLEVPNKISLTQSIQQSLNIEPFTVEETTEVSTNFYGTTNVRVHTQVDVWWQSQDLDNIDYVDLEQSATDANGMTLEVESDNKEIIAERESSDIPLETSESDAFRIIPDDMFDTVYYDRVGYEPITVQSLDGSVWINQVTVRAQDVGGDYLTSSVRLKTNLNVDYDEVNSELSVSASVETWGAGQT